MPDYPQCAHEGYLAPEDVLLVEALLTIVEAEGYRRTEAGALALGRDEFRATVIADNLLLHVTFWFPISQNGRDATAICLRALRAEGFGSRELRAGDWELRVSLPR